MKIHQQVGFGIKAWRFGDQLELGRGLGAKAKDEGYKKGKTSC
jgi:hypothetical protein